MPFSRNVNTEHVQRQNGPSISLCKQQKRSVFNIKFALLGSSFQDVATRAGRFPCGSVCPLMQTMEYARTSTELSSSRHRQTGPHAAQHHPRSLRCLLVVHQKNLNCATTTRTSDTHQSQFTRFRRNTRRVQFGTDFATSLATRCSDAQDTCHNSRSFSFSTSPSTLTLLCGQEGILN